MNSKLLTFLRNNWLTILLAFIPPIIITYYFQREKIELSVELQGNTSVVQVEKRFAKDISVNYNGQEINSLSVLDISVKNTGNRPIRKADFEDPVHFNYTGLIVPPPEVLNKSPNSLKPSFEKETDGALKLKPLLLNPGDSFSFRTFIIDPKNNETPVAVTGRIVGVKTIIFEKADTTKSEYALIGAIIGILVSFLVSGTSVLQLLKKAREITFKTPMFEVKMDLPPRAVEKIAEDLRISEQDWKSSLLLIRIKLEEQLRELASRKNVPAKGGVSSLTRKLLERQIINPTISAGVADVLPIINRELHASESYLSPGDFKNLRDFSLQLILSLEKQNQSYTEPA